MDKLEQAREALTAAKKRFIDIENIISRNLFHQREKVTDAKQIATAGWCELDATLAALSLPVEGVKGEPRVKPLEWREAHRAPPLDGPEVVQSWQAISLGMVWATAVECNDGKTTLLSDPTCSRFENLDAAKAAAQADYERRILSALASTQPAGEAKAEPVEWLSNCCVCGRIVDTRESHQGGDAYGCELDDGRWTCSEPCWSSIVDPDDATTPDQTAQIEALTKRVADLEEALTTADEQAEKLEALLEPHIKWDAAEARLSERAQGVTGAPEAWELEAAAIFMDHVDDDETGSVHRVAAFLRSVAALSQPQPPAEARIAQAERVPAVTEAMIETVGEELFSRGHMTITKRDVRAALEAALQQSAAGEEGKP